MLNTFKDITSKDTQFEHPYDVKQVHGYHANLSRLDNLLLNQKYTYEKIYLIKKDFDTPEHHYDWWLFPVEMPKNTYWSDTAAFFSLNEARTQALIQNRDFIHRYTKSLDKYLNAQLDNWNGYEVRLGKVLLSLDHFIKATANSAEHTDAHNTFKVYADAALLVAQVNKLDDAHFPYNACNVCRATLSSLAQIKPIIPGKK